MPAAAIGGLQQLDSNDAHIMASLYRLMETTPEWPATESKEPKKERNNSAIFLHARAHKCGYL